MAQQLRRRAAASTDTMNSAERDNFMPRSGAGLSAESMLNASPVQHGAVLKLHVPLFYSLCPLFLKRILSSFRCFSSLTPRWTERYLILIGSFLYKFKNDTSSNPKGTPFPMEAVDVQMISQSNTMQDNGLEMELRNLPPGCEAVFSVSTMRKTHYYAVASREEALTWVNSLGQARQETITRSMGHSSHVPYPKSYEYFDSLGKTLFKSKERIKKKIEENGAREMEMSNIGAGGPVPRGYYG